ncbi:MAG: peptidase T [Tissierellia bacterium]|nr:peptidase T [Tissierellia bacterium]
MDIIERFKKYIAMDTRSDDSNPNCPSTPGQLELGKLLVAELQDMGLSNAFQDEHGYVYATLESNIDKEVPVIGFIAHMDTAPDLDGKCVNPQTIVYNGGDIKLNDKYSITESEFPFIAELVGQELITTDGTTLLGADDKAGIAIIMDAIQTMVKDDSIKHGTIKIGFTPDEEIGRGADLFNVELFGADFAYTFDGGPLGELQYENFNAAGAKIAIQGKNVHPGSAKNIMINSLEVAMEIQGMLPKAQRPEYTQDYEGFFLLTGLEGAVDYTEMSYIIRDHNMSKFLVKKELMEDVVAFINKKYGNIATLSMKDSYYNMYEQVKPHMEVVELAKTSMEEMGINPIVEPIRGGTDGARLSYMGLVCPNLFTGGYNYHGRFEFIPTASMARGSELLINIAKNNVLGNK